MTDPIDAHLTQAISDNLENIRATIASESTRALIEPVPEPALIAVSKRQPSERIQAALTAGHRVFGENKVQEAQEHWEGRKTDYRDLELHLIGPLQTNKVGAAMALFDVIQSVDRVKLLDKIAHIAERDGHCPQLFLQVNTGEEDQKSGVLPADLPALIEHAQSLNLPVKGLMCIPPQSDDPALHFAFLKTLADRYGLKGLSMGMSGDYAIAALMGATHIRVGTAIFGARDT